MPTYEYACDHCGHQMEVFQSIREDRLVTCPECSTNGLKRLIGRGAGIIFKGSGFYQTDYKKPAEPKAEGEKSSVPAAAATPPTKTESAPSTASANAATHK
jgi:putative FmdB family regulatory protein